MQTNQRTPRTVVRRSLPPLQNLTPPTNLPGFELTFVHHGHDFNCFMRGRNTEAAAAEARLELADQCPDFDPVEARLVRAVQVR
ncbi:MAG: hypothetical protein U5M53_13810 [Rhodoferax sp.]|nr:hypothetical protein [Rhodoferax sp.]